MKVVKPRRRPSGCVKTPSPELATNVLRYFVRQFANEKKHKNKLTSVEETELIAAPDYSIVVIIRVHHPVWCCDVHGE